MTDQGAYENLGALAMDAKMTPAVAEAFIVQHAYGLSDAETAERLSISVGAVRMRRCRACRALRAAIEREAENALTAERWEEIKLATKLDESQATAYNHSEQALSGLLSSSP